MAAHARHAVSAAALTLAQAKLLYLAYAPVAGSRTRIDEIGYVVLNPFSRFEVGDRASAMFDAYIAFQVATDADGVAPVRIEFDGVNHSRLSRGAKMLLRIAMAAFAGD